MRKRKEGDDMRIKRIHGEREKENKDLRGNLLCYVHLVKIDLDELLKSISYVVLHR